MYIFKFSTPDKRDVVVKGNFPLTYAQELWNEGIKFIIVSTYSNTIKVPKLSTEIDIDEKNPVDFDEYKM
jgi:hypothetical protein